MKIEFEADRDVLKAALSKWGANLQAVVAVEELSELSKGLCKYLRHGRRPALDEAVVEEIADVQIMLWQLCELFGREEVQEQITLKLERLVSRIEASK